VIWPIVVAIPTIADISLSVGSKAEFKTGFRHENGTITADFKVTDSQVSPSGIIIVNYERAGADTTGNL
jgi:hypothetical protein